MNAARSSLFNFFKKNTKFGALDETLHKMKFVGESGGGMVKATILGSGKLEKVEIEDTLRGKPLHMIEDLLVVACNNARQKAEDAHADELKKFQSSLPPIEDVLQVRCHYYYFFT